MPSASDASADSVIVAGAVNCCRSEGDVSVTFGGIFGPPAELTVTLSNATDDNAALTWLVTARPTSTFAFSDSVSVSITVHVLPSFDADATIVLPDRVSFTHCGTAPAPPVYALPLSVCVRR